MKLDPLDKPQGKLPTEALTVVQLPPERAVQEAFLRNLQLAIRPKASLLALPPAARPDTFFIPQPLADLLRGNFGRSWERTLKDWGALSVNPMPVDAYASLAMHSAALAADAASAKLSALSPPSAAPGRAALDWHIGPGGVNAVAAWRMFADRGDRAPPWTAVTIGHIDTGYSEHAALGWAAGASATVQPSRGEDFYDESLYGRPRRDDPRDEWIAPYQGHGTRISATIAGKLELAGGAGFYGAAPQATVIPYRVTDSVIVDHVRHLLARAIRQAVDDGCQVINVSLGALLGSQRLASAIDCAYERGVIVVCAAGQVIRWVIHPGCYNRCVTMAGIGPDRSPWAASAHGRTVDLAAPADGIRRVRAEFLPPGQTAASLEPRADGDGTSYATALCSGAAALWLAWHGVDALRERYRASGAWQIPAAFKWLACQSAARGGFDPHDEEYGAGVLDIPALLRLPLPADGALHKAEVADGPFDRNERP